jgi:hypothetical protein
MGEICVGTGLELTIKFDDASLSDKVKKMATEAKVTEEYKGEGFTKTLDVEIIFQDNGEDVLRAHTQDFNSSEYTWEVEALTAQNDNLFETDYEFSQPHEEHTPDSLIQEVATKIATRYQREKIVRGQPEIKALQKSKAAYLSDFKMDG